MSAVATGLALAPHMAALANSGLFLPRDYLRRYPDIVGSNPLEHYCRHGHSEGRVPNPYFDPHWYRETQMAEVAEPLDPLLHYVLSGSAAGAQPNPYFDPAWYRRHQMPRCEAGIDPLLHFMTAGERRNARPILYFDTGYYRQAHGLGASESPLLHYLAHRHDGEVSPLPEFDPLYYTALRRDVRARRMDPFLHYLTHGYREGQNPSRQFDTGFYQRRYLAMEPGAQPLLHYLAHRAMPGVFPTLRSALHHDLAGAAARGVERVCFALSWHAGAPAGIDALRVFLTQTSLAFRFRVIWANEYRAAAADLSPAERSRWRSYRDDPWYDEDICAVLASCFADSRYEREDGRPVLDVYSPAPDQPLAAAIARWCALLRNNHGLEMLPRMTALWRDVLA